MMDIYIVSHQSKLIGLVTKVVLEVKKKFPSIGIERIAMQMLKCSKSDCVIFASSIEDLNTKIKDSMKNPFKKVIK